MAPHTRAGGAGQAPRYARIAAQLRDEILAGTYPVGASLPSEKELSERFGCSPGTVRVALGELLTEGTIEGSRGRAKRVVQAPGPKMSFDEFHSFAQWAFSAGHEPGGQVTSATWRIAEDLDTQLLAVPAGQRVLHVRRVRTLDGAIVMLETTRYPAWLGEIVEAIPAGERSVSGVLAEQHGVRFSHAEHRFGAEAADAEVAGLLGVPAGSALLAHRRVTRDPAGQPLEWSIDRYIAGRVSVAVGTSWHSNPLQWLLPEMG